jgi:hypothetical protein
MVGKGPPNCQPLSAHYTNICVIFFCNGTSHRRNNPTTNKKTPHNSSGKQLSMVDLNRWRKKDLSVSWISEIATNLDATRGESEARRLHIARTRARDPVWGPTELDLDLKHEIRRVFDVCFLAARAPGSRPNSSDQCSYNILSSCLYVWKYGIGEVKTLGDVRRCIEAELRWRSEAKLPGALTGFDWSDPPFWKPFEYRCAEYIFFGKGTSWLGVA